jgi:nucleoside-diphosphate-sugar epimerase
LAVAELGHEPKFTFAEGLRRTLEWYRESGQ